MAFTSFAVLFLAIASNFGLPATANRSPILIVPGLTGSQLQSRVDASLPSCNTNGTFTGLWISVEKFSFNRECLLQELTLVYDSATNNYSNASGVEVRVAGFGGTRRVEYLDVDESGPSLMFPQFKEFVDYFVDRGYERDRTIRAAPYDWRLAADQLELRGYYTRVRLLIEEMFDDSGEKVTIVVHSMGGPVTLYFLTSVVSQEWKDQYINAFIPLSGAWSGGNEAIQSTVSGNNIFPSPSLLREQRESTRSYESTYWLLPKPSVWGDTVLVTTPNRTYTANDYSDLFTDISYPQGFEMYTGITSINEGFPAPNVTVYCFYGTGLLTPESFIYNASFPDVDPEIMRGDGDGTVNLRSSEVCLQWSQEQSQPFFSQTFPGVLHGQMVVDETVLQAVCEVACSAGAVFTQLTVVIISIAVIFSITTV